MLLDISSRLLAVYGPISSSRMVRLKRSICALSLGLRITPQEYNENNERYDEELRDIQRQEERLDEADKQFYITIGYLLAIFQHAEKIFKVADVNEKRQIVSLILSNLQLDDKNLIFNLKEPFDKLVNLSKGSYGWG